MKKLKKVLALFLALITLSGTMVMGVSAADSKISVISTTSSAYKAGNNTRIYGQTMVQKAITVKKNKVKYITPQLTTGTKTLLSGKMTPYVRFAVWVYDCSNNKRVAVADLKVGQKYQLPKNTKSNKTYSVQIRPYIAQSAWKQFPLTTINAYTRTAQYYFKY